jgi:hypothetical protein
MIITAKHLADKSDSSKECIRCPLFPTTLSVLRRVPPFIASALRGVEDCCTTQAQ